MCWERGNAPTLNRWPTGRQREGIPVETTTPPPAIGTPVTLALPIKSGGTTDFQVTVTSMKRRREDVAFFGLRDGLDAMVTALHTESGRTQTYGLSRLDGEPCWVIDFEAHNGGFPRFSHGWGSRVTKILAPADEIG